ncbi:MAG: DNA cytosine methyltransferase [Thermotogaceae bacterium]|nr:DNA cytosine methyltransferase [Thermotogaceae bacterium]
MRRDESVQMNMFDKETKCRKPTVNRRGSKYLKLAELLEKLPSNNNWETVRTSDYLSIAEKFSFNFIDLFAGAGGLSLGFTQAGLKKIVDVELLPFACRTLKRNFPNSKHFCGDISDFDPFAYTQGSVVHVVAGGPPCQGFSVAGLRKPEDERNFLFKEFIRIIEKVRPWVFVMENVPGIITLAKGHFYREILSKFAHLGYSTSVRILESADFGVPQFRSRAIFIGNRFSKNNYYPKPTRSADQYEPIESAIKDLESLDRDLSINHDWTKHSKQMEERISRVAPGESLYKSFKDAWKRQRKGMPSMTIKENHGGTHIHYKLNRCLSVREMARIQTFPDEFFFEGTTKEGFKQVGNAVPPLLAKEIGLAVVKMLETINHDETSF